MVVAEEASRLNGTLHTPEGWLCPKCVFQELPYRVPALKILAPRSGGYMRKRLIAAAPQTVSPQGGDWLDLEHAAIVEVTSEKADFPVESALVSGETRGWRAAVPGTQTIRLVFDQPQKLRRISLVFEEEQITRTQEFVLQWSSDGGRSFRELVRQQWNFSPPESTREVEEYLVQLADVTVLELTIVPHNSGGTACASLKRLRLS